MSEDPTPYLVTRVLICQVCGNEFTPTPSQAEAMRELERSFPGLGPVTTACERCADRTVQ